MMNLERIAKGLAVVGFGVTFILASVGCNMPSLDFTEDLATLELTYTSTAEVESETESPTLMPSHTPEPTVTPTIEVPKGPTMTPLAPPVAPQVPLSEEGPWLVYGAGESQSQNSTLFIVNDDGSGRRPLSAGIFQIFEVEVKPSGDRFAYILQGSDTADRVPHLIIRRVPGGEIETDLPLISEDVWEALASQEDLAEQILMALSGVDAFEWSPHVGGHYLAFAAALDRPKLDLYRFDTWSNNIRPLTTGPNHRYQPFWSPDGEWVLHLEVERFGEGADWSVDAMSAVSFDGSDSKRLYDTGGNRQKLVKWLDETKYLVTEISSSGSRNLMQAKISDSAPEVLYAGPIADPAEVSFDDLLTVAAFCLQEDLAAADSMMAGVYFYSFDEASADLVLPGACRSVEWWPGKGVFIANGEEGISFIRRTGEVVKQMDEIVDRVALSPDGQWMVLYGDEGATVYTHIGVLIRKVLEGAVNRVIWQPDGVGFFMDVYSKDNPNGSHHLYTYNLDEWELQLVDLDVRGGYFWGGLAFSNP